ncbi:aldehyde dehydrogenase family protein [Parendozoicomonas haliclonae]|uniref:Aldehyde dehydrogenase n=1 Tax=Parendozoicomonas haliclonae TaxID=1960125 RepID=A0A1X7AHC0_9GAMM|nr:aldehyde dehydrogenase family protein [Parendozoicomonas haliclonae]SMA40174.1 putative succinate-semialdehyde dehydrogenase [NADP(+)] 2 [Parendozoicomonas haliclonae]
MHQVEAAQQIDVINPVTQEKLYSLTEASEADIAAAFQQAKEASAVIRATSAKERAREIHRVIEWLQNNEERLLDRVVAESGRCRGDAMLSDMVQMIEDCHWLAENAERILADETVSTPITLFGKKSRIYHEARGVVLVISPWNLPLAIAGTAAMFAFAAGNAVIIKPSEQTPMDGIFEEIKQLSPLLSKALTIVQGGGNVAQSLIARRPDLIAFTGSVRTGKKILAQAAPMVIPVVAELGAKDAMIVCDDADLDRAVGAATWGNMHNSGQSCTAIERLYVQSNILDRFVDKLQESFKHITLGTDADADVGGITTPFQLDIIDSQVKDARDKGATILCGGERAGNGMYQPTIVLGVTKEMKLFSEETFGPVVPVYAFETDDEVIELHNACDYGLSTSIWTTNDGRADRLTRAVEAGCVNINNVMLTEGNVNLPFGGVKYSGYGRMKGAEGLLGMTRSKAVLIDNTRGKPEPNWYPYSSEKLSLMSRLMTAVTRPTGPGKLLALAKVGLALENLLKKNAR